MSEVSTAPNVNTAALEPLEHLERLQTFLAFDYGVKRTGVAYGSRMLREAQPQATVNAEGEARWPLIAKRIAEWNPMRWWWVCRFTPMVQRMRTPKKHASLHASCKGVFNCRCLKWMNATAPPKPTAKVPKMPMRRRLASS